MNVVEIKGRSATRRDYCTFLIHATTMCLVGHQMLPFKSIVSRVQIQSFTHNLLTRTTRRTWSSLSPRLSTSGPVWPYLYSSKRIMAPQLDAFFKQVDSLTDHFIDRLREAVAIPSVSADDERRPDVVKVSTCVHSSLCHTRTDTCRWANG